VLSVIFVISFAAAFVFALGGVGAAIVLIPILVSLGVPIEVAKPVGLFYNTISLAGASIHNFRNGKLDFKFGLPIVIFSFLSAIAGAYASRFIPSRIILILFIAFLLFSSSMFLLSRRRSEAEYRDDSPYGRLSLVGAGAGLLSGLLGVGGGGVISPLLFMMGFNPKKIAVVTAFVVPFSSFSAFLTYWTLGAVDWAILAVASAGGLAGALLGTHFLHARLSHQAVRRVLASVLLLLAAKLIVKLL